MYPGPSVSSFGSVIAVSQVVVEVAFFLVAPSAGVILELDFSTHGVVENGLIQEFSKFPFELPPTLWSGRGWIPLSDSGVIIVSKFHLFSYPCCRCCRRLHMTNPLLPSPVGLWKFSVVHPWQEDGLLQIALSRPRWSRRRWW